MTANQIAYSNYVEQSRHNLETEAETQRNNVVVSTETNRANLAREAETNRANKENEKHNKKVLKETTRSNKAREAETSQHNRATEAEDKRSHMANEAENKRSNEAQEFLKQQQIDADKYSAYMHYIATVTAAELTADSHEKVALIQKEIQKMNNTNLNKMNKRDNATKKQIARFEKRWQATQNSLNRLLEAYKAKNDIEIRKQWNSIHEQMNKIQSDYNNGYLTEMQERRLWDAISGVSTAAYAATGQKPNKGGK